MGRYVLHRLALMVLVLSGVATVTFVTSRLLPGEPVAMWIGAHPTQEQIDRANRDFGFDQPIAVQYALYAGKLVQGDLGISLRTKQPVRDEIARRFAATFELVTAALLLSVAVGVPLGILSATRPGGAADALGRMLSLSGVAMPSFFLAMVFQIVFFGWLGAFPLQGRSDPGVSLGASPTGFLVIDSLVSGDWTMFLSAVRHITLPAATIGFGSLAIVARMTRSSMIEVLRSDYIVMARACGLRPRVIEYRFALKNALIPIVTALGLSYGFLLGGSFMVESVFDWPGIGAYAVLSITHNYLPAVVGVTLLYAASFVTVNLVVDLLYLLLDPRIRSAPSAPRAR